MCDAITSFSVYFISIRVEEKIVPFVPFWRFRGREGGFSGTIDPPNIGPAFVPIVPKTSSPILPILTPS